MFNAMKYIKKLEEVGFQREQAEAQVEMLYETIESELATKTDLVQLEYRIVTKLGMLAISLTTIAVAMITWLVKAA